MKLIRRLTGGLVLICLAALVASCMAIYPGALPRLTPTPAARADSASTFVSDLADAVDGRSNHVLQPVTGGSSESATLYGGFHNPGSMLPTDVRRALIIRPTGIFDLPGGGSQSGLTVPGQEYVVIGVSPDGQWWAVDCPPSTQSCWISANPVFVQPATGLQPSAAATPAPVCSTATLEPPRQTLDPQQASAPQSLNFVDGVAQVPGTASMEQPQLYYFFGAQGQNIRILITSQPAGANFSVSGVADAVLYKSFADPSRDWTFTLPTSQNYQITVMSPSPVNFVLQIQIDQQDMELPVERITFAPGQSSAVVSGLLQADDFKYYVVTAVAGQQLRLLLVSGPAGGANFAVNGVCDGVVYKPITSSEREASIPVSVTQDYLITLFALDAAAYQLEVTIPTPLPPPPPPTSTPIPTATPRFQYMPSTKELQACCKYKEKWGLDWCCDLLSAR